MYFNLLEFDDLSAISCSKVSKNITEANSLHRMNRLRFCGRQARENTLLMVDTGQGKNFVKVREKSGNFTSSQGKFKSLKEVREIVHFTDVNRVW